MKKIKLLLIAPSFYPVHGGAGLRFYRYLPYFYQEGIETTVICGTPKEKKFTEEDRNAEWHDYRDGDLVLDQNFDFADVLKYKLPGIGSVQRTKILLQHAIKRCADNTTKPDIVHIIAPIPYAIVEYLKKIKQCGVKLIYSHTIAKVFSENLIIKYLQIFKLKRVYKHYDCILVQSNFFKDTVRKISANSKVVIIPNGVDTEKFSPPENTQEKLSIRSSLDLPHDATIILSVGAIHPRKRTDLLISVWAELVKTHPLLHLVLVGPRYHQSQHQLSEFGAKIEEIIELSNKKQNIHFIGISDHVDLYLKAADLFIFPSEREGMPNVVIEAMSSGLPIVLTPFLGLSKELGVANEHYLLAERNPESLKNNILKLIENQNLSDQILKQAREWILSNLTIKQSVHQHVSIYEKLLIIE